MARGVRELRPVVFRTKYVHERVRVAVTHALLLQKCDLIHVLLAGEWAQHVDPLVD